MSFSDMMSSGRGPGVIGMFMALIVLLGFGLLFMFASDDRYQGGGMTIESLIIHQANEIGGLNSGIDHGTKSLDMAPARIAAAKELSRLKHENQALQEKSGGLKNKIVAGKAAVVRQNEALENYKTEYRTYARGKAKGETLEKLETTTGAVYNNVSIREVTAIGMQIRHDDGQKRIPYEELPMAMKDRFQFDPKEKERALLAETSARSEHEASVAVAQGLDDEQMVRDKIKDAEAFREKTSRNIVAKEAQISTLLQTINNLGRERDRAAAESSSARAAGHIHIDKGDSISGDIRSTQNRIATLQAEINQLKSSL